MDPNTVWEGTSQTLPKKVFRSTGYICKYVCMCACMYVWMYVWMYVYIYIYIDECDKLNTWHMFYGFTWLPNIYVNQLDG